MVGHSGVGKSTLVNALVPGTDRAIGHVNAVTGRGRHTSTSALMLRLPDGEGWIVDTPGIRSFGLAHVQPGQLIGAFPDLEELTDACPRGCTHGEGEPECGLDDAVAEGRTEPERVESFRRLLASRERVRRGLSLLAPDGPGAGVADAGRPTRARRPRPSTSTRQHLVQRRAPRAPGRLGRWPARRVRPATRRRPPRRPRAP